MHATGAVVPLDNASVWRQTMKYLLVKIENGTRTVLRAYISSKRAGAKKSLLSLKDPSGNYLVEEIDDTAPKKGGSS